VERGEVIGAGNVVEVRQGGTGEEEEEVSKHVRIEQNQTSSVFNLGVKGLTEKMAEVLHLGIKFVPLQRVNLSRVFADLERLRVKMLWKIWWRLRR
jgi:hypothetical protein